MQSESLFLQSNMQRVEFKVEVLTFFSQASVVRTNQSCFLEATVYKQALNSI